jgi:Mg2+/Co2+ transporter CorB
LDTDEQHRKKQEKPEKRERRGLPWALQVFFIAVALSAVLSGVSSEALGDAGLPLAFGVLILFILLGILFDIIGVAVTAADERPFHSMAAHRTPGAREALGLIRKADRVSSFCNDVVGDICGIVSGATAAVIALRLQEVLSVPGLLLSLAITALASGLTVGGKALGKRFALQRSTQVLTLVGRFLQLFSGSKR